MITLTDNAIKQIKFLQLGDITTTAHGAEGLRISIVGGGCSGLSYELGFEKYSLPSDKIIELSGIKVFIDPKSALYLKGLILDYVGGLNGQGFTFSNPNATKSCGCGTSFGTE
jgi:iron-sulfur cluster assembly protein